MATATKNLLAIAATLAAMLIPLSAIADGFPGKGSNSQWSAALPYYNRGNRYLNQGRFDDAAADFRQAVALYEYDPDFYTNLGIAYRKLDQYVEAEQAFKKATELNPDDWMPWSDLANAYLKQNKLQETIDTFNRTLKCNPPAAEKEAIQKDIADIKKILRMQGGGGNEDEASSTASDSTAPSPGAQTPANKASGNKIKVSRKVPPHGQRPVPAAPPTAKTAVKKPVNVNAAAEPAAPSAAPEQESMPPTANSMPPTTKPVSPATKSVSPATKSVSPAAKASASQKAAPPTDGKSLKQSGWDYIYK